MANTSLEELLFFFVEDTKNRIEYKHFFERCIVPTVDKLEDLVYVYDKDKPLVILSHLADADGFGAEITLKFGLERIIKFLGDGRDVVSHRVMSFNSDSKHEDSIQALREAFGDADYVVADSPTLDPDIAAEVLGDGVIMDHHPNRKKFNSNFTVCNPHEVGLDGGPELSASMQSVIAIEMLYSRIERSALGGARDKKDEKKIKENLSKLKEDLDYISAFGICGSRADMQEDVGMNKVVYDYFGNMHIKGKSKFLNKIDTSFFGYATKDLAKIVSQSNPVFNLKYRISTKREMRQFITQNFGNVSSSVEVAANEIISKYRFAFIRGYEDKRGNLALNMPYINLMSQEEIDGLNGIFLKLVGSEVVEKVADKNENEYLKATEKFRESSFEHHSDDLKVNSERVASASEYLVSQGIPDPTIKLSERPDLIGRIHKSFKDNVTAFGDPYEREWAFDLLNKKQYRFDLEKALIRELTVAEGANFMTAMSKQRVGEKFMRVIASEIYGKDGLDKAGEVELEEVLALYNDYKKTVWQLMTSLQDEIICGENLIEVAPRTYFLNVDFLRDDLEGDIALETMNGVVAGIAANVGLLPSKQAVFFTGCTVGSGVDARYKISGRATQGPYFEGIKINKFMNRFDGGGHDSAAACSIPISEMNNFINTLGEHDLYSDEVYTNG